MSPEKAVTSSVGGANENTLVNGSTLVSASLSHGWLKAAPLAPVVSKLARSIHT